MSQPARIVLLLVLPVLAACGESAESKPGLMFYCAAGIRKPVEAAAKAYEKEYGVRVDLQYGGSNTILSSAEVSGKGDLYLPGDDSYIAIARKRGLLDEAIPLARMAPVLAVKKGNPKKITRIDDLLADGIRFGIANPNMAAVGKKVKKALTKAGSWEKIEAKAAVQKPTVNDVAVDIKIGQVDAGFIWDATVSQYPELEIVKVPELADYGAKITVGVLRSTKDATSALKFARYLGASDRGLLEFPKFGFTPVEGDVWAEKPQIRLLAGAMLRVAIDDTIKAFEEREGVEITRVYNGCGILVAQMKAGDHPDAYFSCEKGFMEQVKDLYLPSEDISRNQLVIVYPKDSKFKFESLKDLAQPGVRVGIGHEQQCAMGALTKTTLEYTKLYDAIHKNVKTQVPTGDMLMNQLSTGALDAVVVYISNAAGAGDKVEAVAVNVPCAMAIQPVAVGKESKHKHLVRRLIDVIKTPESRKVFEANGFHWQLGQ